MNLAISSTGFKEPGFINIEVNSDNIKHIKLPTGLTNLIVHRAFHLLAQDEIIKFVEDVYLKLPVGGIFTIYCIDIYELSHRMHRRAIPELEFNNLLYEKTQKNCYSTLFFIELCNKIGFKKQSVSFHDVWSKMEFVK